MSIAPVTPYIFRAVPIPYLREAASRSASEQLAAFPFLKHLRDLWLPPDDAIAAGAVSSFAAGKREKLEQLRALDNGIQIAVVKVNYDSVGVDVQEDVTRVEAILKNSGRP